MEILIVLSALIFIVYKSFIIVKHHEVVIIERFGIYHRTLKPGLNIIFLFIDKIKAHIDLREHVANLQSQYLTTKDNIVFKFDTVVFYQITDAKRAVYEIEDLLSGIKYVTSCTTRDVISEMEFDKILNSQDYVTKQLRMILDDAVYNWGCKINRVELKEIVPSDDNSKNEQSYRYSTFLKRQLNREMLSVF